RTAWSVEVIHELLELMARYRLNRLHWHLTDDSGWRFAVPGYDRLTEIGAQLPRPDYGWYSNVLPAQRDRADARAAEREFNGHYTAEEIAGIVAHAGELGIEVMPELDLPGHMAAAIRAYPELGDPRLRDLDPAQWDHPNDLLWPSEASFAFLTAALETVAELFPFSVVHIGGDECKHQLWEADAALMARYDEAADHGPEGGAGPEAVAEERSEGSSGEGAAEGAGPAASPQTGGPALPPNGPGSGRSGLGPRRQGMFTDHARQVLAGRSRRVAAWDELIGSPTTGEELIVAWRAQAGVEAARASGHEWIFADCTRLYLNRVAGDPATEPPGMFGPITPRDLLELEAPHSPGGGPAGRGARGRVWRPHGPAATNGSAPTAPACTSTAWPVTPRPSRRACSGRSPRATSSSSRCPPPPGCSASRRRCGPSSCWTASTCCTSCSPACSPSPSAPGAARTRTGRTSPHASRPRPRTCARRVSSASRTLRARRPRRAESTAHDGAGTGTAHD